MRILDAAANRAAEGLRVVEDFTRFVLDDGHLTRLVKELRHELAEAITSLPRSDRHAMRDTRHDVGTLISTPTETARTNADDVCEASCERVKQSLRSLEEFSKVTAPDVAAKFENIRYRWYTLEKVVTYLSQRRGSALETAKLCVLVSGSFTADLVDAITMARVGMIQIRDKQLDDRQMMERVGFLCGIARSHWNIPVGPITFAPLIIVNDRVDVAAATDADGVHLGQEDLPVREARRILGPRKIIGISTHNIEQARVAVLEGANYIGVGPTFPSTTKSFDNFPGTSLLKQVAEEISLPAFAIGGITLGNLPEVLTTGIKRVAISGAVEKAEEPGEAVRAFLKQLADITAC